MSRANPASTAAALLEVRELCVSYPAAGRAGLWSRARVSALAQVSFELRAGETLALVGESGSGKSTAALALLGLLPCDSGQVLWSASDGRRLDLTRLGERELRQQRPDLGVVFQDPFASLDPRRSVAHSVGAALAFHGRARGQALARRVEELLGEVGLPGELAARYPHELSGGQRQRVALARALSLEPRLLVCDEIVSALDASVQAQVLELLARLQRARGLALLFVSHDLGVVRHVADRVAVLYAGRIVESGSCEAVLEQPAHPYTRALVAAVPGLERRPWPEAEPAVRSVDVSVACAYRGRCALAEERCGAERPQLRSLAGQSVACHVAGESSGSASA